MLLLNVEKIGTDVQLSPLQFMLKQAGKYLVCLEPRDCQISGRNPGPVQIYLCCISEKKGEKKRIISRALSKIKEFPFPLGEEIIRVWPKRT